MTQWVAFILKWCSPQKRKGVFGAMIPFVILFLWGTMTDAARAADVVVLLSAKANAYQQAVEGFREVAESKGLRIVKIYDMKGDFKIGRKILKKIKSKVKPDMIYTVGVWALQLVAEEKIDIPVVYAMVLNPPSVLGTGATNITGASMNVPVGPTLGFLKQLSPEIRRVGTVFNPAVTGYLIEEAHGIAQELGLELVAKQIRSSKEAIIAVKSLQEEGVDALWIVPDKTVLDPKVVQQMLLLSFRKKIPLIGLSERHAKTGALLAVSFASGKDIGRQAAGLAYRVLQETPAAEIPYTTARRVNLFMNQTAAKKMDIEIPDNMAEAHTVGTPWLSADQEELHIQITDVN